MNTILPMTDESATFQEFLVSARLGPLRCGLTRTEVESLLGKPKLVEDYPGDAALWSYGRLEVRFAGSRVDSFGLYFTWGDDQIPQCVNPVGYFPDRETTIADLRNFLNENRIDFGFGRTEEVIRTAAGVWIVAPEGKLMSIVAEDPAGSITLGKMLRKPTK